MASDLVFNQYVRSMDEQFSLYEWFARQYGLQHKSLQILLWIRNYPVENGKLVTQKLLTEKTYSSKQVVNATIKSWREKGYVELLENPSDKRHKLIKLTALGEEVASAIYQKLTKIEVQATSVLTPEEQALLTELTTKYNQALKTEMEALHDRF